MNNLKLKLLPRSTLRGKVSTHFPAKVTAASPVTLATGGGGYTIGIDVNALSGMLIPGSVGVPYSEYAEITPPAAPGVDRVRLFAKDVAGVTHLFTIDNANTQIDLSASLSISASPRFVARISAGAGPSEEITGTQATALLDPFTSALKGLVPASGGGTVNFLRADGTWAPATGTGTPGGANGNVQFNNSGVLGGLTDIQLTARIQSFTSALSGAVPASGGGTTNFLRADGTWAVAGGSTVPGGATGNVQFNNSGAFGGLTDVQLTARIQSFTSALSGATPASGGGTTNFLRADGSWAAPGGSNPFPMSSATLATNITDETGNGLLVFNNAATITAPAISGGTINNTTIGATTPAAGTFTNLTASNSVNTGAVFLSGQTSVSIAADQNNWNPAGFGNAVEVAVDGGAADRNITGLIAAASNGQLSVIRNAGTTNLIRLVNQSASSTAANRFSLANDINIPPGAAIALRYNSTTQRWHSVAGASTSLSNLSVRSSGAAFDLAIASDEAITANRTLTVRVGNANRILSLGGDLTTAGAFTTSGAFPVTLTATGSTTVTLPTGGTLISTTSGATGFDAIAPTTTLGDMIYRGASNNLRLAGNITTAKQFLTQTGTGAVSAAPAWGTITATDIGSGAALTKTDDTNVTLTLGGTPASALLAATSVTVGWIGTLAAARLNANVVQAITNDTNVTGSITAQNLTLGWTGQLAIGRGGTGAGTAVAGFNALSPVTTLGDMIYRDASNNVRLPGNTSATKNFLTQTGTGAVSAAPVWGTISAADIGSGAALTRTNDTNVTLTLGGTPATSLLAAVSLTLGWTGQLGMSRGGTGADLSATGGAGQYVKQASAGGAFTVGTIPASDIVSGAALTKTDDTNVTLTLGGTPGSALLASVSLTLGWNSVLTVSRGGTGQPTQSAARGFAGLNIEGSTGVGDTNTTVLNTDRYVFTNAAFTAARTWTLPASNTVSPGRFILFGDLQGTLTATNTLTIQRGSTDTIDGGTSITLSTPFAFTGLINDAGNGKWKMMNFSAAPNSIANSQLAQVTGPVFKGRDAGTLGNVLDMSAATATGILVPFSTTTTAQGVVPGSNNVGSTFFLNAAGAWAVPATGGAATSVSVGSTTVLSGTSGRVLYDNAGVLGEYTQANLTAQINAFVGATGSTNGTLGAVPQPLIADFTAGKFLKADGTWAVPSGSVTPAALTKTDDTNVTLTLGGTPSTALLQATSITVGWTGTLAAARLNANVVQAITNDTNVTGSIATQTLTLGWSGQLAIGRGGTGQATALAARSSTGLNVESGTGHGDSIYTILATDRYVYTNSAFTASRTWTLPAANAVNAGGLIMVGDLQGTITPTNTLIISRAGADTINGATTFTLSSAFAFVELISDGVSKWFAGKSDLSAQTAGVLPLASGGTNANLTASNGGIFYSTGTAGAILAGTATAGQMLRSGASAAPTWSSTTWPSSSALGDIIYGSGANALSTLTGNITTAKQYLSQTGNGSISAAPAWATIAGADITGAALTSTNDTNVTITLGGTPATSLLRAASITMGWTGTLAVGRGGTGLSTFVLGDIPYASAANTLSALAGNITATKNFLSQTGNGSISAAPAWSTIATTDLTGSAALTKTDDTNVTLTLGGTPATALLRAASITVGWTGTLAAARLNANVVQAITNDTNVTGSISAQVLTLGWTGTLAIGRGGTGQSTQTLAYDALSPTTTLGDIEYRGASNNVRLAGNTTATKNFLTQTGTGAVSAAPAWGTISAADIGSGAALTKTDDTNVTLTLGGSPTVALLAATSLTLGWTGTLALSRLANASAASIVLGRGSASGAGVMQEITLGSGLTMTGTVLSSTGGTAGGGGATIVSQSGSLTLTKSSTRNQNVTLTTMGQSVTLPDATTYSSTDLGGPIFSIANAGGLPIGIRRADATLLCALLPGGSLDLYLDGNSVSTGPWHFNANNPGSILGGLVVTDTTLSSTYTGIPSVGTQCVELSSTLQVYFVKSGSNTYAFAVDCTSYPPSVGTPTSIDTVAVNDLWAIGTSTTTAQIAWMNSTTFKTAVLSVGGTTVSIGTAATKATTPAIVANRSASQYFQPLVAVAGSYAVFLYLDGSNNVSALPISWSGTTSFAGTAASAFGFSAASTNYVVACYNVDSTHVVVFYMDNSGTTGTPYSIRACVGTLSGTPGTAATITMGSTAGVNDVCDDNTAGYGVCRHSGTAYTLVYRATSTTFPTAVGMSISGTTITVGSTQIIESASTNAAFGNAGSNTGMSSAFPYATWLYALSSTTCVLSWNVSTLNSTSRTVVLTNSSNAISVGTIAYGLCRVTATLIFPISSTQVVAFNSATVGGQAVTGSMLLATISGATITVQTSLSDPQIAMATPASMSTNVRYAIVNVNSTTAMLIMQNSDDSFGVVVFSSSEFYQLGNRIPFLTGGVGMTMTPLSGRRVGMTVLGGNNLFGTSANANVVRLGILELATPS